MTNLLAQLTILLQDDLQNTKKLNQHLAQEKELLRQRDFKPLSDIAQNKQLLIKAIEENNQKKINLMAPLSENGQFTDLLEQLAVKFGQQKTQALKTLNKQLEKELAKCRQKNAVNGQVIVRSLENNQQLADIVTGNTQKEELYNALGQSTSHNGSKSYSQKV
jgi:flagellar biosynthesis/type III secretory pathway chaperone